MSSSPIPFRFVLLALSFGVLSLVAGATLWRIHDARPQDIPQHLVRLPEPRVIADFRLTDHHGQAFALQDLKGHWSLLFFGFTSCPDVCPSTLYQLQQARQLMAERLSPQAVPRIYLVSVDPERDSPAKLQEYLQYFDPQFIGVSGEDAQLRALTLQLGIAYHVEEHTPGAALYTVDHSASILLLDPQARLYAVLRGPHEAATIAAEVSVAVDQES